MYDELRFIWDVSPVGLAKVSREGKFLAVSPRFAEIVGYSETELLDRTYQQITHPDDLGPDTAEARHLAENPEHRSYQMVKRYISKDGRTVWVNLYVHALCDSGDTFTQFFVFAAELSPVSVISKNASTTQVRYGDKATILTYVKSNPKEAAIVCSAILALAKGGSLIEMIEMILRK